MKLTVLAFLSCVLAVAVATDVLQCSNNQELEEQQPTDEIAERSFSDAEVEITGCTTSRCRLKKKTKVGVQFPFTPSADIEKVENRVFGHIVGVPLPFVGVDGTDACVNIYDEEGNAVGCPLTAGKKYLYKNAFDILSFYPNVNVDVEWGLHNPKTSKDIKCFMVGAKIVN